MPASDLTEGLGQLFGVVESLTKEDEVNFSYDHNDMGHKAPCVFCGVTTGFLLTGQVSGRRVSIPVDARCMKLVKEVQQ